MRTEGIEVSIKDKHNKRLDYIKDLSREHYIGFDNKDPVSLMRKEWVPAKIRHENREYKVDIRVKGQSTDHWGEFGSIKSKSKKAETIMGMKRFALQLPKTRGFLNEWYFHQLLKYSDLIHLCYKFVNLSINGDTRPVYALEENFGKRLLENNHRKEGQFFVCHMIKVEGLRSNRLIVNYRLNFSLMEWTYLERMESFRGQLSLSQVLMQSYSRDSMRCRPVWQQTCWSAEKYEILF